MKKSKIGGQAVIEGVMMRGETAAALAVRDEKKRIRIKTWRLKKKTFWSKVPIVRGVISFVNSMTEGTKTLMSSADVFGEEEEPTKFEKWCAEKLKINVMNVAMALSLVLGVALAVGLFIVLPSFLSKLLCNAFAIDLGSNARIWIEAGIKLLILFAYIYLTSLMKDIKRVYMYHGAEHKTINCYENELPLDVEHARSCKKFHNRCGTTFLFFVVLVGIIVFALIKVVLPESVVSNEFLRILIKLACLPLTAGLAYELLMVIASSNFFLFYPLRLPGMLLQSITTKEPTDDILEVAIASFKAVQELDANPDMPTYDRLTYKYVTDVKRAAKTLFEKEGIVDADADVEWIISRVTGRPRSSILPYDELSVQNYGKIMDYVKARASGKPLAYVLGDTDFYGITIKCDHRALIPRPETEELVKAVLDTDVSDKACLDLCCGSGCIGVALKKLGNGRVTLSDVSEDALSLAKENAAANGVEAEFIKSDLFENIDGTFDVIVSNPPYIKSEDMKTLQKEVRDFEPHLALDGGKDGLDFYRIIAEKAPAYLNDNGLLALEVGVDEAEEVRTLLEENFDVEIKKDLAGIDRIVIGRKKNV